MPRADGPRPRSPTPASPGDDGSAPTPALARRPGGVRRRPGRGTWRCFAALQRARLLVPVVAVLGEVEVDEPGWRTTRPATWRPRCSPGATAAQALLAFTGARRAGRLATRDARRCRSPPRSRPRSALQEGAAALRRRRRRPGDVRRGGRADSTASRAAGRSRAGRRLAGWRSAPERPLRNRHPPARVVTLVTDRSGAPCSTGGPGPTSGGSLPPAPTAAPPGRRVRSAPARCDDTWSQVSPPGAIH